MEGKRLKIDEKVTAAAVAVLLAVGVLTISQSVFAERVVEPFSELAVLGPMMKIGDYPQEVAVGQPLSLYLYLGNHEGRLMYYRVLVKLDDGAGNLSESNPLEAPVQASYEAILMEGMNHTLPVNLSLTQEGVNRRLVFELHAYNDEANAFEYQGGWCHLWLNVTRTPS